MNTHTQEGQQIDNFAKNIDRTMGHTLLIVLLNWNNISQNESIMTVLDMETNNLCKMVKIKNPEYQDSFVQAHVFTIMLMLMMMMSSVFSRSINNDANVPIYISNTFGKTFGSESDPDQKSIQINEHELYKDVGLD
jgi:hypothetical protein